MTEYAALRVLVVDDDPMMVDLLRRVLVGLGVQEPAAATDGARGLELLDGATVDIVFCDIDMPGMDGVEFLRHLGQRAVRPSVVVISSTPEVVRSTVEWLGSSHQLRVLGSLRKPATRQSVSAMLDLHLEPAVAAPRGSSGYITLPPEEIQSLLITGLEVHYQPIHCADTGEVHALEALARLRHADYGLLAPDVFVPACERIGATATLLRGVLSRALTELAQLRSEGHADLGVAVNLSADDLTTPDLVDEISGLVSKAGLPPDALTLELTETRILRDTALSLEILTRLRVRGMNLAIDDYGTGFASLKQLRQIPFSELKVDRLFVTGAHHDSRRHTMLASTLELARKLELATVAEGVETQEELDLVRQLGCDNVQGYFLSRPMTPEALRAFL